MAFITTFGVTGMAGDHCARIVRTELGRLHGVLDIEVDLTRSMVELTSTRELDRAVIEEAIDDAGYTFLSEPDERATLS